MLNRGTVSDRGILYLWLLHLFFLKGEGRGRLTAVCRLLHTVNLSSSLN